MLRALLVLATSLICYSLASHHRHHTHHLHHHKPYTVFDVYVVLRPLNASQFSETPSLPYAITILTQNNEFDLRTRQLQDGTLTKAADSYEDVTVLRLRSNAIPEQKTFVGIRLFDVPEGIQPYAVLQLVGNTTKVSITNEHAQLSIFLKPKPQAPLLSLTGGSSTKSSQNSCSCTKYNCACCQHATVKQIRLNDTVCVNITYVPLDIGIKFSLSVDSHVYYSKEYSVLHPPEVCIGVPHLKEFASLCVQIELEEVTKKYISGCVNLDAVLYAIHVSKVRLGCFTIPL